MVAEGFPSRGLLLFFYDAEQMSWGFDPEDAGSCLYYWIRDEDLRACRFDRAWMILQCG